MCVVDPLGKVSGKLLGYFPLDRTHETSTLWLFKNRTWGSRFFFGNRRVYVDFLWKKTNRALPRATVTPKET